MCRRRRGRKKGSSDVRVLTAAVSASIFNPDCGLYSLISIAYSKARLIQRRSRIFASFKTAYCMNLCVFLLTTCTCVCVDNNKL